MPTRGARAAMAIEFGPFVAGAIGGIGSWFMAQLVAEPVRRFLGMRREIVECVVDFDSLEVRPRYRRPKGHPIIEIDDFTDEDAARLLDAQNRFRRLGTQMQTF